ncbi:ABC transporter ATP-binding protein [Nocardiopsis tropica]|uniref:ATP-binding cassette domain-containing protein n=1 Tax=Nocardiopsis tropica TaxID=109330 RepID=A0ABU7KQK1_9ACTN|nr:ATP-binding cassette domain-containing protein [Nocardiopsis umidischolae]MEE2051585.1 ATP-binding cassette domain-containing protein [Nocardiopsis umidischolae]
MIEIRGLTRRFGARTAVDGLTFAARPGQVTGFLGPNGAGKSTTLRVLLGLDRADGGTALIDGRPYAELRRPATAVGAQLDGGGAHPARTARAHLGWIARANGLPASRVEEVLEGVGLGGAARARVRTFSLGMGRRLDLAAALLGDPGVLVMDEPVNGLDPEGIRWVRAFTRALADEGRTVLLSSHFMGEVARIADHLVVIDGGRLVAEGRPDEVAAGHASLEDAFFALTGRPGGADTGFGRRPGGSGAARGGGGR